MTRISRIAWGKALSAISEWHSLLDELVTASQFSMAASFIRAIRVIRGQINCTVSDSSQSQASKVFQDTV